MLIWGQLSYMVGGRKEAEETYKKGREVMMVHVENNAQDMHNSKVGRSVGHEGRKSTNIYFLRVKKRSMQRCRSI